MNNEDLAKVHLTKDFSVSKETLYDAWTEPEQLKQWWKPMDKQLLSVENDIRQGGNVIYQFEGDLTIKGEYKEAVENETLVYTWNWEFPEESVHKGEYLLTVQFKENGDGSSLDITQENFKEEHAIKPHEEGWNEALNELALFLKDGSIKQS